MKRKGFTLIEILIVISIMAMFTAMIYSSFDKSKAKSRDQKRVSDISTIQLALEQYFNKHGIYPINLDDLVTPPSPDKPYLSEMPKDPITNKKYNDPTSTNSGYFPITRSSSSANCTYYHLWATFEQNNQYVNQKKGFDSTTLSNYSNFYACGTTGHSVNGQSNPLIYDVTPN